MKTKLVLLVAFCFLSLSLFAQKQITKSGTIEIFSETPLFTIEGVNQKVASIINTSNGEFVASTLVRSFKFEEALVEEHFNENYIESHKFPKAVYKGKIVDFDKIDLSKDGTYDVVVVGKLTIHGTTNDIKEKGKITVKGGVISATSTFDVSLAGYKVKVEETYKDAIKDAITLRINFNYKVYNK